jgi:hypothetical protein
MKKAKAKRAVKVVVLDTPVTAYRTSYVCPSCKTECITQIEVNVTRFNCIQCYRELIISSRKRDK